MGVGGGGGGGETASIHILHIVKCKSTLCKHYIPVINIDTSDYYCLNTVATQLFPVSPEPASLSVDSIFLFGYLLFVNIGKYLSGNSSGCAFHSSYASAMRALWCLHVKF